MMQRCGLAGLLLILVFPIIGFAGNDTVVASADVLVSSCNQLTVTARYTGDDNRDGSTAIEYNTINSWPGTVACAGITDSQPRQCLLPGLMPGQGYWVRVTFDDPDGISGTNPEVLGPFSPGTCGADSVAPTALFITPSERTTIGGIDRIKLQVWDEGGLSATPLSWWVDDGAPSTTAAINPNYDCGVNCSVWEFDVDWTIFARGIHGLTAEVTDSAGNVARAVRTVSVRNSGTKPAGSGLLLRRTLGSQQCMDCHNLPTHSSQYTGTTYGNWSVDCLTCHRAHFTLNVYLIEVRVLTPADGRPYITFWNDDIAGGTNPIRSYLGNRSPPDNSPWHDGICETCHTRTEFHRNNASGDHTHHQDRRCINCHVHNTGFAAAESPGGTSCRGCHPNIWEGMNGATAKTSRHSIGSIVDVNDSFTDTSAAWASPLSAIPAEDRSCVNMCHQDHIHNSPGGSTHDFNVHQDASTPASRVVGRNINGEIIAGTPARTDFDSGATNGGLCISCHTNPVQTNGMSIDASAYDVSAHDFTSNAFGTWSYALHDGSAFDRNCTKCHADSGDPRPTASGLSLGAVHFSDFPDLLTGAVNPGGNAADYVCYTCHGSTTIGVDLSGKDLPTALAKASHHPVDSDSLHDTLAEAGATFADGSFSGANRHVNCLDCHGPHEAQQGLHTPGTSTLAGALVGASGIGVANLPNEWTTLGAGDFATNPGPATNEYQVCFKCHSSFAFNSSPPANETDQSLEFNANNDAYHWIMTDQTADQAPDWTTANDTPRTDSTSRYMTFASGTSWTKNSPMVCSDCHGSDDTAGVQGPHGSTESPILKKAWTASSGITTPDGLCFDCHDFDTYAGESGTTGVSGFTRQMGGFRNLHGTHSARYPNSWSCAWCHSAVPHGWNRKALVVFASDPAPYNAGGNTAQITSWTISNSRSYSRSSCGTETTACH
jgi:hypothetical protein